jgi:hypothetical protein
LSGGLAGNCKQLQATAGCAGTAVGAAWHCCGPPAVLHVGAAEAEGLNGPTMGDHLPATVADAVCPTVPRCGVGRESTPEILEWVQCDACDKWRTLPDGMSAAQLPDPWTCGMNTWNARSASCDAPEDDDISTATPRAPRSEGFRVPRKLQKRPPPTPPRRHPASIQRRQRQRKISCKLADYDHTEREPEVVDDPGTGSEEDDYVFDSARQCFRRGKNMTVNDENDCNVPLGAREGSGKRSMLFSSLRDGAYPTLEQLRQRFLERRDVTPDMVADITPEMAAQEPSYENVLAALEHVDFSENNGRLNTKQSSSQKQESFCLGLVHAWSTNIFGYAGGVSGGNGIIASGQSQGRPQLGRLLARFMRAADPSFTFTSIQVNKDYESAMHLDKNNLGPSYIIGLGDYSGGRLWGLEFGTLDIKKNWVQFDGNLARASDTPPAASVAR